MAVVAVGGGIAVFIGSWRTPAVLAVAVAVAGGVELVVLGAVAALSQAWPRPVRPVPFRIAVPAVVVATLALAPAGLALILRDQRWSPGIWLAVAAIVIALLIRTAAGLRRKLAPATWGSPHPAVKAEGATALAGVFAYVGLLVGCACLVVPAAVQEVFFDDPFGDAGDPVAARAPTVPTPSWSPPATADTSDDGDPAARIRHDLESRVLRSAGVPGPVTSECSRPFEQPDFVCTVTYQGSRSSSQ